MVANMTSKAAKLAASGHIDRATRLVERALLITREGSTLFHHAGLRMGSRALALNAAGVVCQQ